MKSLVYAAFLVAVTVSLRNVALGDGQSDMAWSMYRDCLSASDDGLTCAHAGVALTGAANSETDSIEAVKLYMAASDAWMQFAMHRPAGFTTAALNDAEKLAKVAVDYARNHAHAMLSKAQANLHAVQIERQKIEQMH